MAPFSIDNTPISDVSAIALESASNLDTFSPSRCAHAHDSKLEHRSRKQDGHFFRTNEQPSGSARDADPCQDHLPRAPGDRILVWRRDGAGRRTSRAGHRRGAPDVHGCARARRSLSSSEQGGRGRGGAQSSAAHHRRGRAVAATGERVERGFRRSSSSGLTEGDGAEKASASGWLRRCPATRLLEGLPR